MKNIAIWIVCSPRTGSTYLCELFNNTNLFIKFTNPNLSDLRGPAERNRAFDEWLRVYKSKKEFLIDPPIHLKAIDHQFESLNISIDELIQALPGIKILHLSRKNKIKQSVSLYLAEKLNKFHIYNEKMFIDYNKQNIAINKEELIDCYKKVCNMNFWDTYFKDYPKYNIFYEDLCLNPQKELSKIFKYINFPETNFNESIDLSNKRLFKMEHFKYQELERCLINYAKQNIPY